MIIEVCANSLESALNAQKGGADRIELCAELGVGGITPSPGLMKSVKKHITIPIHVLIRPRSGDFTYSKSDFETIKNDILFCKDMGFEGVVSGVLYKDFKIDIERTKEMVDLAKGMEFTFHRAFDWVLNPMEALDQLQGLGVANILTSGQEISALKGLQLLERLQEKASVCTIMPGGGVKPENVLEFKKREFKAVHLSGTKFYKTLDALPGISMNSPVFFREEAVALTDERVINKIKGLVK
ncbi:copper homeostasis protein CutC [Sediminicola sp. YIK13]|uniref:copper homeostasis protein CutC n=1 Tax=Sediminicola sp. YIK13 TaxID=1453352 RepID=UPI0007230E97|nr:copper homeostasis protein CutC [Sediminicola sp. YIK13]ALM08889.1 copper homeostasis protein CutC [Sediminicola sp. YIK13]